MKKIAIFLILALISYPTVSKAQPRVYPHLQIFLVPSQPGERSLFITFWDGSHKLAAGPFPIKLLERVGLNVLLDVSYSKPNDELPGTARLKIQTGKSSSLQDREDLVLLDQPADLIAARGASKMFPDGPFLVIGHKAPSDGVLRVGKIMEGIQKKLLACDKEHRKELDTVVDSLKGAPFYEHVVKTVESTFPPCSLQRP
jgi:hypothetical protein